MEGVPSTQPTAEEIRERRNLEYALAKARIIANNIPKEDMDDQKLARKMFHGQEPHNATPLVKSKGAQAACIRKLEELGFPFREGQKERLLEAIEANPRGLTPESY
jgi:hypothetical protein